MDPDVDYILPTEEQKEEIERLAALGYSLKDMALYLGMSFISFKHDAETEGCVINHHIKRGKFTVKANAEIQLLASAEKGNITAIQQLQKSLREREYQDLLLQLEEGDKDD